MSQPVATTQPANLQLATQGDAPSPLCPGSYPRRVLVCLTGLSPQVATETLYALLKQAEAFVPTEFHLITTQTGREKAVELLGDPVRGLAALWRDHGTGPMPAFDPATHIHLVGEEEAALADVTTAEHNVSVADCIVNALRPFARDEHCAIHASLAGGRKSMSFYMGYVMSLLGRAQDRLSHVLVNAPFDRIEAFSFPPVVPRQVSERGSQVAHSTADAKVQLARVAFVRMSEHLPQLLLAAEESFEGLVRSAELALQQPRVVIDLPARAVAVGQGAVLKVVKLPPMELALYGYLAKLRQAADLDGRAGSPGGKQLLVHDRALETGEVNLALVDAVCGPLQLVRKQLLDDWGFSDSRRQRVSKVNRLLREGLGADLGGPLLIAGPKAHAFGKGIHGLFNLDANRIHFGNVPTMAG